MAKDAIPPNLGHENAADDSTTCGDDESLWNWSQHLIYSRSLCTLGVAQVGEVLHVVSFKFVISFSWF